MMRPWAKRQFKTEYRPLENFGMGQAKRGRPRKTNVIRDSSGKSRGEIVDFTVVTNQPHRRGTKDPRSHLLGFPLGRLHVDKHISEDQLRAGNAWAMVVVAYANMMGITLHSVKSGALGERIASGFYQWGADDIPRIHDDEEERQKRRQRVKDRYDNCFHAVSALSRTLGRGNRIMDAMRMVCIEERYPSEAQLGDLRLGLNAVHRFLC